MIVNEIEVGMQDWNCCPEGVTGYRGDGVGGTGGEKECMLYFVDAATLGGHMSRREVYEEAGSCGSCCCGSSSDPHLHGMQEVCDDVEYGPRVNEQL
jgi:hypothetical protein